MKVVVARDPVEVGRFAARFVVRRVRERADLVLGLATGRTVVSTYDELARYHEEEGVDFSEVTSFNLDEYVGLAPDHPQSYHRTMERMLFERINVDRRRAFLPNGCAPDLLVEAERYEQAIEAAGGIGVQLLGIGRNGHVAFNEPGSSLASRTRVKRLSDDTIMVNGALFGDAAEVPRHVLTMGIGTIMASRFLLLLAFGAHKAVAVREAVEGPVTAMCPASALQFHPHAFVIVDEAAASALSARYETVEEVRADPHEEFIYEHE
jgi:glucosamine-6-phosphate deaminase